MEPTITVPVVEETVQAPELPPIVDMLFSHITGVNQWMNRFYASNEGIQNDINTIRVSTRRFSSAVVFIQPSIPRFRIVLKGSTEPLVR